MLFADDIVEKQFTKVFRGYDVQEVDLFLDEVIRTLEEHERERDRLLFRVEALLTELERYDAILAEQNRSEHESEQKNEASLDQDPKPLSASQEEQQLQPEQPLEEEEGKKD